MFLKWNDYWFGLGDPCRYRNEDLRNSIGNIELNMRGALKSWILVLLGVATANFFAWLFVIAVDVTTIGSGRLNYSNSIRTILNIADRAYPMFEFVLSAQGFCERTLFTNGAYYRSWLLTILIETLAVFFTIVMLGQLKRIFLRYACY